MVTQNEIPEIVREFMVRAMDGVAPPEHIRAVHAWYQGHPDHILPDDFPAEPAPESPPDPQSQDAADALYKQITRTRHVVTFEETAYVLDERDGLWDRVTQRFIANFARTELDIYIKPSVARDVVASFWLQTDSFERVGTMDIRRLMPCNGILLDFERKVMVLPEDAVELMSVRKRWDMPALPEYAPSGVPIGAWLDDNGFPIQTDVWEYAVERYGFDYLQMLAVLIFGQVRKEMPWAFSAVANYGKSTLIDALDVGLPGSVALLGTRAVTEQGRRFSNIESAAAESALVVVDEADKSAIAIGLLNDLSGRTITIEQKGVQSYQGKRVGNILFLAGGPPDLDLHGQGVLARLGRMFEFEGDDTIPGRLYYEIVQPKVGRYLVEHLMRLAWEANHDVVFIQRVTGVANEVANNLREPLADAIEQITIYEPTDSVLRYGTSDIIDILLKHFPDDVENKSKAQLYSPVGRVLASKFGVSENVRLDNGTRRRFYRALLVQDEFPGLILLFQNVIFAY